MNRENDIEPATGSPHAQPADAVLDALEVTEHGLSRSTAEQRLAEHGPNQILEVRPPGILRVFLRQFLNPLIYVLVLAALVSLFLAEWLDAGFIGLVLLVNAFIGAIQEWGAQNSAQALKQLAVSHARVIRDGEMIEIDARQLVPGDIVLMESGMRVPADLRLVRCKGLEIDESLLTGESLPVTKDATRSVSPDTAPADRPNMAFGGSMVTRGRGTGVVTATGDSTEVGRLAESLAGIESSKAPLIQRLEGFTYRLMAALAVVIVLMAAVELVRGASVGEILLISIALAVSAIPEGLPVAVTVALSIGMNRMTRRHVIVRRLVAVESLGSCTVIASDKTGTLTVNELTARRLALPWDEQWEITGEGDDPAGEIRPAGPGENPEHREAVERLVRAGALCNEGYFGPHDDHWEGQGDAVDVALLVAAHKAGQPQGDLTADYPLIDRIPYEPAHGFAASSHEIGSGSLVTVKGAAEQLLPRCSRMASPDGDVEIDHDAVNNRLQSLTRQGMRVLAFAERQCNGRVENDDLLESLNDLVFLGFAGLIDPPRPDAAAAVAKCHSAGLRVLMLTGDHPDTALSVARELGIADNTDEVITGTTFRELENRPPEERTEAILKTRVFARIEPAQKLEIIRALTAHGEFVAVTGDGVNDAPALSFAHVGVAMGERGTDVARESSDLVITDDHIGSVAAGIEEGRIAYQNIRKVIFLLISTGAAELVLFILAMAANLPLPLTAVQLLWLNLVTNGIQHVGLAFEPGEGDEMRRPPRRAAEPIFNRLMLERVLVSAATMGATAFALFYSLRGLGMEVPEARNMVLLLMVLFENVQVFNSRSEFLSVFRHNPLRNPILLAGTLAAQLVHIGAMYTPIINDVLGITPVTLAEWTRLLVVALSLLLVMEGHKLFRNWRRV